MARKKLTPKQIAERTRKAKETRERKKKEALEQLGMERKKVKPKRTRKMTKEQKQAAAERLAKARKARGKPQYTQYDDYVRALPDDDPFSIKNVHKWIKNTKDRLANIKSFKNSKIAKEREEYTVTKTYLENLESYLRKGVYLDNRYGEEAENKVKVVCRAMAYDKDGVPKRTVGVWYPDIGETWTTEMEKENE